ncbi:hypothetical protein [Aerosakkonema funiforme]|uniref:hypothetical protein n=1 Tax=Aerosakkonema funiforme TaxID=1246630 RepID=UPI0035BAAC1C
MTIYEYNKAGNLVAMVDPLAPHFFFGILYKAEKMGRDNCQGDRSGFGMRSFSADSLGLCDRN